MSMALPSWEREETLEAIPLHKPLRLRVVGDVSGVSIFGLGELRGWTSAGRTYEHALSVFFDFLLSDYYELFLHPSEVQTAEDDATGIRLRGYFWKKFDKDEEGRK